MKQKGYEPICTKIHRTEPRIFDSYKLQHENNHCLILYQLMVLQTSGENELVYWALGTATSQSNVGADSTSGEISTEVPTPTETDNMKGE